jgi:hypothetical protein
MVYFLSITTFPGEKSEEVGKCLPKLPKLPEFVKPPQIFVSLSSENGEIKAYALYEVEDDKSHEGFIAISKRLTGYFGVEGVKYKLEKLMTVREALALLGLG